MPELEARRKRQTVADRNRIGSPIARERLFPANSDKRQQTAAAVRSLTSRRSLVRAQYRPLSGIWGLAAPCVPRIPRLPANQARRARRDRSGSRCPAARATCSSARTTSRTGAVVTISRSALARSSGSNAARSWAILVRSSAVDPNGLARLATRSRMTSTGALSSTTASKRS